MQKMRCFGQAMASRVPPQARCSLQRDSTLGTMKTHHETDLERVLKAALARETMEKHRSPSSRDSSAPPATPASNAAPETIVRMAIRTILVPTDFSPQSRLAVTYARHFAEQFGAQLILLHAYEPVTYAPAHCPVEYVTESQATRRQAAEEGLAGLIGELSTPAHAKSVSCRPMVVEGDAAWETDRVARECVADLILVATHGYTGLNRLLMGSTAEKMVRHAPCPVLVVREKERDFVAIERAPGFPREESRPQPADHVTPDLRTVSIRLKNILVPLDFSEQSLKALRYAVPFAQQFGARLTLLHVLIPAIYPTDYPVPPYPEPLGEDCFAAIERKLDGIRATKVPSELPVDLLVRQSFTCDGILEVARETHADLIVATTHGRTGLKHLLMGSTAEKIVRQAPCPVLVVREREHDFVGATATSAV